LEGKNDSENDSQSLKIAYDISGQLTLTSVTTNWLYKDNNLVDYDFSPATLIHGDKHSEYSKISQELRLDYSADRLKWLQRS
jgi:iron complex outermembrane receptor protein